MTKQSGATLAKKATSARAKPKTQAKAKPKGAGGRPAGSVDSDSLVSRIAAMTEDATLAEARRVPGSQATSAVLADVQRRLRNSVTAAISRAKIRSGSDYTTTAGEIRAANGDVLVVMGVTCLGANL